MKWFALFLMLLVAQSASAEQIHRRPIRTDGIPTRIEKVEKEYAKFVKGTEEQIREAIVTLTLLSDDKLAELFKTNKHTVAHVDTVKIDGREVTGTYRAKDKLIEVQPRKLVKVKMPFLISPATDKRPAVMEDREVENITYGLLAALADEIRSTLGKDFEAALASAYKKNIVNAADLNAAGENSINPAAKTSADEYWRLAAAGYLNGALSRALMKSSFPNTFAFVDGWLKKLTAADPFEGGALLELPPGFDQSKLLPLPPTKPGEKIPMLPPPK